MWACTPPWTHLPMCPHIEPTRVRPNPPFSRPHHGPATPRRYTLTSPNPALHAITTPCASQHPPLSVIVDEWVLESFFFYLATSMYVLTSWFRGILMISKFPSELPSTSMCWFVGKSVCLSVSFWSVLINHTCATPVVGCCSRTIDLDPQLFFVHVRIQW
jgi:hypothetical protein